MVERNTDWTLWFWWVVITPAVGTLGLAVADVLVLGLPDVAFVGDNGIFPLILWFGGLLAIVAPSIGVAQLLILRRWIGQQVSWSWVMATVMGVMGAMVVNLVVNIAIFIGCGLIWPGFVIGFAQWVVLRHYVQKAGLWIVACGIGWSLIVILGWAILPTFLPKEGIAFPFYPMESAMYWGVVSFIGLVLFQAITGLALSFYRLKPVVANERMN